MVTFPQKVWSLPKFHCIQSRQIFLFEANKLECLSSLALILALLEDRTPIKRENLLDFADEQNPESEVHALIKAFLRSI